MADLIELGRFVGVELIERGWLELPRLIETWSREALSDASMEALTQELRVGVQNMARKYDMTVPYRPDMIRLIRATYDHGVTFFDTAEAYGPFECERILGESIAAFRDKVVITTKAMIHEGKERVAPDKVVASLEKSLALLRTDRIDVFQLHGATADGKVVFEAPKAVLDESQHTVSTRSTFMISSLLQEVTRSGTAARAQGQLKRPDLYGKTGTTNEFVDAWFCGFGSGLVAVAWIGFDNPHTLGHNETGAQAALPMWIRPDGDGAKRVTGAVTGADPSVTSRPRGTARPVPFPPRGGRCPRRGRMRGRAPRRAGPVRSYLRSLPGPRHSVATPPSGSGRRGIQNNKDRTMTTPAKPRVPPQPKPSCAT